MRQFRSPIISDDVQQTPAAEAFLRRIRNRNADIITTGLVLIFYCSSRVTLHQIISRAHDPSSGAVIGNIADRDQCVAAVVFMSFDRRRPEDFERRQDSRARQFPSAIIHVSDVVQFQEPNACDRGYPSSPDHQWLRDRRLSPLLHSRLSQGSNEPRTDAPRSCCPPSRAPLVFLHRELHLIQPLPVHD
jgi:hypothetical protein